MIEGSYGDIFSEDAEALVNPVNTIGTMGRGLALAFAKAFAANAKQYQAACKARAVQIGSMFITERMGKVKPRWIINFPTKEHWRNQSELYYIEDGLVDLVRQVKARQIASIAIPALGCGLGGLPWDAVRPLIVASFAPLPDVRVILFGPGY